MDIFDLRKRNRDFKRICMKPNLNQMKYSYQNQSIVTIQDWEDIVYKRTGKSKDWKQFRSAYSIAEYMLLGSGETDISGLVSKAVGETVVLNQAIPELEVRFDKFGKGRFHDLGIHGTTLSGRSVFIGIESKVDETFGPTIGEAYLGAKSKSLSGIPTKAPERIENLLGNHFQKIHPSTFNLRYQLLYSTVGTLALGADISVLLVIVFKTPLYRKDLGILNHQDYLKFFQSLNGLKLSGLDGYKVVIGGKSLFGLHCEV